MNAQQIAATSIYNQIVDCAVEYMLDHSHWTPAKAISKSLNRCQMFKTYYDHALKDSERLDMERLVRVRRNAARGKWEERA